MSKTRKDFELDTTPPASLRDLVIEQIAYTEYDGKTNNPLQAQSIDDLMQSVFRRIEQKALETYHSNELPALRQWVLEHILTDEIVDEAAVKIADALISPVRDWQEEQDFDPIGYYKQQLVRKSEATKRVYLLTATRFVGIVGRKKHYTDEDILKYIQWLDKHYSDDSSYAQDLVKLTQFLRRLPGADRRRELPIDIPKTPKKKKYTHAFTLDELETLAWSSVILNLHYKMVLRLIASTVYGRRVDELTNFEVKLNGNSGTILFPVKKGGEQVPHPIPQSLIPLFRVPVQPISKAGLQRWLRQICDEIGLTLPYHGGYHSTRRRVATTVKQSIKSDIDTYRFMRWADPRELSILAQYDQTRYEDIDKQVLSVHPVVKVWEEVMPYLLDMNKSYRSFCVNP
jgi:hypothetical protein